MFPPNLTINADDFGLDLQRSHVMAQGVREGLVHAISVLPFPESDREHLALLSELRREFPQLQIGAHLSLIETEPTLASTPRYSRDQAAPGNYREFLAMYGSGRLGFRHALAEWTAQVRTLVQRLGGEKPLSHLDSHQHVHVLPGLWQACCTVRREWNIPRLRIPYEGMWRSLGHRFPFGLGMQALARLRLSQAEGHRTRFAGFFTSMHFTCDAHADLPQHVGQSPNTPFELMVHPDASELDELRKLRHRFQEWQAQKADSA
jgi:chitin disaccharide deacetylase